MTVIAADFEGAHSENIGSLWSMVPPLVVPRPQLADDYRVPPARRDRQAPVQSDDGNPARGVPNWPRHAVRSTSTEWGCSYRADR